MWQVWLRVLSDQRTDTTRTGFPSPTTCAHADTTNGRHGVHVCLLRGSISHLPSPISHLPSLIPLGFTPASSLHPCLPFLPLLQTLLERRGRLPMLDRCSDDQTRRLRRHLTAARQRQRDDAAAGTGTGTGTAAAAVAPSGRMSLGPGPERSRHASMSAERGAGTLGKEQAAANNTDVPSAAERCRHQEHRHNPPAVTSKWEKFAEMHAHHHSHHQLHTQHPA